MEWLAPGLLFLEVRTTKLLWTSLCTSLYLQRSSNSVAKRISYMGRFTACAKILTAGQPENSVEDGFCLVHR